MNTKILENGKLRITIHAVESWLRSQGVKDRLLLRMEFDDLPEAEDHFAALSLPDHDSSHFQDRAAYKRLNTYEIDLTEEEAEAERRGEKRGEVFLGVLDY